MPLTLDSSISYPNRGETTTQFEISSSLSPGILDSPYFEMDLSTMPAAPASTDIAPNGGPATDAGPTTDPGSGSPVSIQDLIRVRDQQTDPAARETIDRLIRSLSSDPPRF